MRTFGVIASVLVVLLAGLWALDQRPFEMAPVDSAQAMHTPPAQARVAARHHRAARAEPRNHCAHNHSARQLVLVSIAAQRVWLCARTRTVYTSAVTTGMRGQDTATPIGRFRIEGRERDTVLYPSEGGAYPVRYWIPFDAPAYGFHDASWQRIPFGSPKYRTGGSHGCVHMPLAAVRYLYRWARTGAVVVIRA